MINTESFVLKNLKSKDHESKFERYFPIAKVLIIDESIIEKKSRFWKDGTQFIWFDNCFGNFSFK